MCTFRALFRRTNHQLSFRVPRIQICQNFVKYEDAIDTFMPSSRRTGSSESNRYFKSNKLAVLDKSGTHSQRHQKIASCNSKEQLCDLINPNGDRYYKLNLINLKTGRQPTIEFRQHSATSNYAKVNAWVRFCVALVHNSASQQRPGALKPGIRLPQQFDMLFEQVIKDRALRDVFTKRRAEVLGEEMQASFKHCCSSCGDGGSCEGEASAHQASSVTSARSGDARSGNARKRRRTSRGRRNKNRVHAN